MSRPHYSLSLYLKGFKNPITLYFETKEEYLDTLQEAKKKQKEKGFFTYDANDSYLHIDCCYVIMLVGGMNWK